MKYFIEVLNKINLISISYADSIEDTPVDFSTTTNNNVSSIASLIGFIVTFLLITGILLFLFMVISKKNKLEQTTNKSIRILDRVKMDHNSNLFVLKIQDELHIIGKTENSINLITTITDKEKVQEIELDCEKNHEHTFQSIFNEQVSSLNSTTAMYMKNFKSSGNTSKAFKFNSKR